MTSASVSRPLRKLLASSPAIYRDGNTLITNDACPAELLPELEALRLPRISDEDVRAVVALLKEHAGRARFIVNEVEAIDTVAELMEAEALAFDVETAALPNYRSPIPIVFTKAGTLRKRQPTTGSAGLALDPHRSRVRLVSAFGGTDAGVVDPITGRLHPSFGSVRRSLGGFRARSPTFSSSRRAIKRSARSSGRRRA
jgi:hypothetical protein